MHAEAVGRRCRPAVATAAEVGGEYPHGASAVPVPDLAGDRAPRQPVGGDAVHREHDGRVGWRAAEAQVVDREAALGQLDDEGGPGAHLDPAVHCLDTLVLHSGGRSRLCCNEIRWRPSFSGEPRGALAGRR